MKNKSNQALFMTLHSRRLKKTGALIALAAALAWLPGLLQPLAAQTVIGGRSPDSSAILELRSIDRGLLLPRLTSGQRDAISKPQPGLVIFNTTLGCLEINLGTTAPDWTCLTSVGSITSLDCVGNILTGSLAKNVTATGVTMKIPYTGGDGGTHRGQVVTSTGVTGLTATLESGSFANGAGTLSYALTGTPSTLGTASFALNIGGQTCTVTLPVSEVCRAKVNATDYKTFMCYNLGAANTSADPFTPSWEIIGGYWQWGRKGPDPSQWLNTNTVNFAHGPTDGSTTGANITSISNWATNAPNGAWSDALKTANDPCPQGFRVPTKADWDGVMNTTANPQEVIGANWNGSATNYSTGVKVGPALMLPAAGGRNDFDGSLYGRGSLGGYWSSTESGGTIAAHTLALYSGGAYATTDLRRVGFSLRCVAE